MFVQTSARSIRPSRASPSRFRGAPLCAAIAALGLAGAVRADTVNLNYTGPGAGRTVRVTLGAQSWDVFAGRLMHHAAAGSGQMSGMPQSIVTFCVDILQGRTTTPGTYTGSSLALLSGNAGMQNLGYGKQQAIYDIFQAASRRQLTNGADYAAAFQVALWEVVYDYNPNLPNRGLGITGGNFRTTALGQVPLSVSITAAIQSLLSGIGLNAGRNGIVGLKSAPYQDQLYLSDSLVVPLPLAAWPGIAALGLVAAARWRRRIA